MRLMGVLLEGLRRVRSRFMVAEGSRGRDIFAYEPNAKMGFNSEQKALEGTGSRKRRRFREIVHARSLRFGKQRTGEMLFGYFRVGGLAVPSGPFCSEDMA